ncbi:fatty acid CoA ligase FadD36 [Friedmanniella endophytica]|uniref:Fatty acid CoA ligase FadD36 n=1 Tax=Microlunatus kandeliicorticis TaxID=1759536 RepID=A0A7W3IVZ0_9ACTN|nr:AMP-binding protein [Microlunatus kandeliicorticis]MBA8796283.1 fatty acid CoA ligase FadD36 [Microlunatus kandeliicorticis]
MPAADPRPRPSSVPDIVPEVLPDVEVAGERLTGEELAGAAERVAAAVAGAPVVAIEARPSTVTVAAVLGCLRAGVPFVPLPPDAGRRERAHLIADAGARLLVGTDGTVAPLPAPVDTTDPHRLHTDGAAPLDPDVALLLYTSGTTGLPKGVPVTRAAVVACLDGLAEAWAWGPADTLVHGLPLFHVHGLVLGVLGALRTGSRLVHTGRPTPAGYAAAAEAGGTLFFGVPTVWGRVAADAAAAAALSRARLLVSGSAGLPRPVAEALAATTGRAPVERYGMTETLITVATRHDDASGPGWVGHPIAGVETRVVETDGRPVPAGEIGRLEVRGTTVFRGYHGRPDTGDVFTADGWFRTGDAAAVDATGRHRILGRAEQDLISSGGYRIGAGEIEAALLAHPAVAETAVVGEPDADLGQRVVAYVVRDGSTAADEPDRVLAERLIGWVVEELSVHKRPREVRFVAALPRNAMGKLQKSLLG